MSQKIQKILFLCLMASGFYGDSSVFSMNQYYDDTYQDQPSVLIPGKEKGQKKKNDQQSVQIPTKVDSSVFSMNQYDAYNYQDQPSVLISATKGQEKKVQKNGQQSVLIPATKEEGQKIQKNDPQNQGDFNNYNLFYNKLSADILSGSRNQKEEDFLRFPDVKNAQENSMNHKPNHKYDIIDNLEQLSQFDDDKNHDQYQNELDHNNEVDGIALQFLKDPSQLRELNKLVKKIIPFWSKLESVSKEDEHGLMSQILRISFGEQAEKTKQLEKKNQVMQLRLDTQEKIIEDLKLALMEKAQIPSQEENEKQDEKMKDLISSIISENFTEVFTKLFTVQVKPTISKVENFELKFDDLKEKVKSLEIFNQIINEKYTKLLDTIEGKKIEENIKGLLERVDNIENNSYKNHIADLIGKINQAYKEAKELNINTKFLIQENDARFNNLEQHIQYLQHIQSSSQKIESQNSKNRITEK